MKNNVLCQSCIHWVNCGDKDGEPNGFCLSADLFTYTKEIECCDYDEGKPMTEEEWEKY